MSSTIPQKITAKFEARTPVSREMNTAANNFMPGGDTRTTTFYAPYPAYMDYGEGCYLQDRDGNRYIDFLNNYTTLIHGHAHPPTVEVVNERTRRGVVLGAPVAEQYELAELLCDRVPSIEQVRFNNSGTEATMMAMRAARAYTGKDIIIKMDGGYHGHHDFAAINVIPDFAATDLPKVTPSWPGIPACTTQAMLIAPFNDLGAVERLFQKHEGQIAAIITEPLLGAGGAILPRPGYLQGLRDLADKYDALLIFDEIITFRLGLGGLQKIEGVTPDLTTLGKIIGGGFPVGVFGGKKEIMAPFDPRHPKNIYHGGTFCGQPVTMAAGVVTLEHYRQPEMDYINALGERLAEGINKAFEEAELVGRAGGRGSVVQIHWTHEHANTSKEAILAMAGARDLPQLLHLSLLNRGIFLAPRGLLSVSTVMTEDEINLTTEAVADSLRELKPYAAEAAPHLLVA